MADSLTVLQWQVQSQKFFVSKPALIVSDTVPGYKKPLILDCDIHSFNHTLL
jgi:hypothetical protein